MRFWLRYGRCLSMGNKICNVLSHNSFVQYISCTRKDGAQNDGFFAQNNGCFVPKSLII